MSRIKLFICLALIMLLPLQSLAAGYQLVCFMQQHTNTSSAMSSSDHTNPYTPQPSCHEHMMTKMVKPSVEVDIKQQSSVTQSPDTITADTSSTADTTPQHAPKSSKCISICAQANMVALPSALQHHSMNVAFNDYPPLQLHYASVTLPSLQRPPINLA